MSKYFTVDRRDRLHVGQTIGLLPLADAGLPEDLLAQAAELVPTGISDHGLRYFTGAAHSAPREDRNMEVTVGVFASGTFSSKAFTFDINVCLANVG